MKNHSTSRLIGFSHSLMDPTSLSNWLRIEERHVSNFPPRSRSQPILMEFLPFNIPYSSNQWKAMIKPAWKIIQASPNSSVLIFVPSKHQCQAVGQHLVQCHAFNMGQGDAREGEELLAYGEQFQHQPAANMLVHGILILDQKMSVAEIRLGVHLFRTRKLKIMILPCDSSWKISNEQVKADTVIVMGTRCSITSPAVDGAEMPTQSVSEMELSDLVQMQSFVGQVTEEFKQSTINRFVVMCEKDQLETYETFLKSGLPLESTIEIDSGVYLDLVLERLADGRSGIKSRSEIMACLSGTLLLERLQVNPLYYGVDTRNGRGNRGSDEENTGWSESAVVDKWVEQLVEHGCVRLLGLEEVEMTEIGNKLIQEHISVNQMEKSKKMWKEYSYSRKKLEKLIDELTIKNDLIDRTKEFYFKLPRHLKDKSAWFLEGVEKESNQDPPNKNKNSKEETDRLIKRLLIDCFEVGRIAYNDLILAKIQAELIIQLIKKIAPKSA